MDASRWPGLRARPGLRVALVAALAALLGLAIAATSPLRRMELAALDLQNRWFAPAPDMSGTLGVDIDEQSLAVLAPQLGAWPWDRDVFARVTDFLREAGAAAIVFDIVFSEPRAGDEAFAAAIRRAGDVLLAAIGNLTPVTHGEDYAPRLDALAWSTSPALPHDAWPDLTLPVSPLTAAGARAGVIAVRFDEDQRLRRIALLHGARGRLLPGLPLAALYRGPLPALSAPSPDSLQVGSQRFAVDDSGRVLVSFSTPQNLRIVPFHVLLLAALGGPDSREVAALVKGRRVFIGSSAPSLNDLQATPLGVIPGLQALLQIHVMLGAGRVLAPRRLAWDGLLMALAVAVPLLLFSRSRALNPLIGSAGVAAQFALVGAGAALAWQLGQYLATVPALAAGLAVHTALSLERRYALYLERQRLQLEKLAAEEASRLKSQFMSQMTHDLRTPLTAILGFNRLARDADESERERLAQLIDRSGQHLLALINNILDQARIEAGQMVIHPEPTAIGELVEEVRAALLGLAQEKRLMLGVRCAGEVPATLLVDGLRVKQVLVNLLGNAIRYTTHGAVTVEVDWSAEVLRLAVQDTGPGIAPEMLARIFAPFEQGEGGATRGGSGLGLTVSRHLAELSGGSLTGHSTPGEGARFEATFHAPSVAPPAGRAPAPGPRARLAGLFLVADDSEDIRSLLTLWLGRRGARVIEARDGAEAVEMALRERPAAVLLDLDMPVLNGLAAARQLRARGFTGVLVALTGHADAHAADESKAAGCDAHLAKPVEFERLAELLVTLLERSAQRARTGS